MANEMNVNNEKIFFFVQNSPKRKLEMNSRSFIVVYFFLLLLLLLLSWFEMKKKIINCLFSEHHFTHTHLN